MFKKKTMHAKSTSLHTQRDVKLSFSYFFLFPVCVFRGVGSLFGFAIGILFHIALVIPVLHNLL